MPEIKVTFVSLVTNIFLFIIKIFAGLTYNSISLVSDAFNSLLDIVTSIIIWVSIKLSRQGPDERHQFGHSRAQPIAGLIVAIITGVLGFQIFISATVRFFSKEKIVLGILPLYILLVVIFSKLLLFIYTYKIQKQTKSSALKALYTDHRNDVLLSTTVLFGLFLSNKGYFFFDALVGMFISIYIIRVGFSLAKENINYVLGGAPSEEIFKLIESTAKSVKGVIGTNDLKAHLLGTLVDAEVHIYIDKKTTLTKAHDIANKVKDKLESLPEINNAFIHIDPFDGNFYKKRSF